MKCLSEIKALFLLRVLLYWLGTLFSLRTDAMDHLVDKIDPKVEAIKAAGEKNDLYIYIFGGWLFLVLLIAVSLQIYFH